MDARTDLKSGVPGRPVTEGPGAALRHLSCRAAGLAGEPIHQPAASLHEASMQLSAVAHEHGNPFAEIFRKTLCVADLKPGGRFIAKDLFEAGCIPLLTKTLLDNGFLHSECATVIGCSMAENLQRVSWNSDQEIVRPASRPSTAAGGSTGLSEDELQERRTARQPAFGSGNPGNTEYVGNRPGGLGRRGAAPSSVRTDRPRRRAMRTSDFLQVVLFSLGLGVTAAHALDLKSPANAIPEIPGVGPVVRPQGSAGGDPSHLQSFLQKMQMGDTVGAVKELENAFRNGSVSAGWKLGRMYADGDGVAQDRRRAFDYFRRIAERGDDVSGASMRFVAGAWVAMGLYYRTGIPNSDIKPDQALAYQCFNHAAVNLGDADAQYHLGVMYLEGQGVSRSPMLAARWFFQAASKGQYEAQAEFGRLLFKGQGQVVPRDGAKGLMWLRIATDTAPNGVTGPLEVYNAAWKQATEEERSMALVQYELWKKGRR